MHSKMDAQLASQTPLGTVWLTPLPASHKTVSMVFEKVSLLAEVRRHGS